MTIIRDIEGFQVQINLADIPDNQKLADDKEIQSFIAGQAFEQDVSGIFKVELVSGDKKTISWELIEDENCSFKALLHDNDED
jgi:hypothetical protein